ncbi:MAG: hypothetical protein ACLQVI_24240 [Polyangiaceae bacterium]|jgi:hypothetical protein
MSYGAPQATLVIERPVDVVRAQFFDVDHHIRDRVHPSVALRWSATRAPGEARVRQETNVLGRLVAEEFVIEEGEGGRWVKRFVDGPNVGGAYVASFAAERTVATRIEAEAKAPPKGFDNGLGKLSDLGVQKALEKLLGDHRRALEGYEPGRVRGDVSRVLRALREKTSPLLKREADEQRAIMSNLLEAATLTAIIDEVADDVERHTLKAGAQALCFLELDDAAVDKLVSSTRGAAVAEGVEGRCEKIGSRLRRHDFVEVGLAFATLIAQVSHGLDARELALLQRIARAAGLPDSELGALIARVDGLLSGPVAAPPLV